MAAREVIFLGTSSQVPTRSRSHNAFFLRWDAMGILFDPGEGTQRQMVHAGLSASQITHIAITHFHGDHCLGFAGITQRISLDQVPHEIPVLYPASGQVFFERLRHASIYFDQAKIRPVPIKAGGDVLRVDGAKIVCAALDHGVECFGYRLQEDDGRRMLPEKLDAAGVRGPDVGKLAREGTITVGGKTVRVEDVSESRRGQSVAAIMDTRPCEGARVLAKGADLVVCESTYLQSEAADADAHRHMTAAGAATLAKEAGARKLALTHFSQRYGAVEPFRIEAAAIFPDAVAVEDLTVVEVPARA
jgi:ribonuclease Z